jgi:hypothetical protein
MPSGCQTLRPAAPPVRTGMEKTTFSIPTWMTSDATTK